MKNYVIDPVSNKLSGALQEKIDRKTKPIGALGLLEELAHKIGLIQGSLTPQLNNPHIVVFAGDHGIVDENISAYPQNVTYQMVMNFLNGGAAINVFCRQNQITLKIVDAGVNADFPPDTNIIHSKIAKGTRNFLNTQAMTRPQCEQALQEGADIVDAIVGANCNIIGFGDMGIGNTTSASIIMSQICQHPICDCVGRGAGLNDAQLDNKIAVCKQAIASHHAGNDPIDLLTTFGGFEIVMMVGAMLQAAKQKMVLLVDGFIATSAFCAAHSMNEHIKDYAVFSHLSDEAGHAAMLSYLNVRPVLQFNMRLGEGTGAAVSFPLIQSAIHFLNEMASFESAGVSDKR